MKIYLEKDPGRYRRGNTAWVNAKRLIVRQGSSACYLWIQNWIPRIKRINDIPALEFEIRNKHLIEVKFVTDLQEKL